MSLYRIPAPAPALTRCASTRCNRPVTSAYRFMGFAFCSMECADWARSRLCDTVDERDIDADIYIEPPLRERGTPPSGAVNILIVFVAACVMVGLVIAWGMGVWGS